MPDNPRDPIEAARLSTLATRIETEPPSRALDAEIWEAIGLTEVQEWHCRDWRQRDGRADLTRGCYLLAWAPEFTSSVDAALSLTDGYNVRMHKYRPGRGGWASLCIYQDRDADAKPPPAPPRYFARGKTLAAAITAAALRARATTTEQVAHAGGDGADPR